MDTQFLENEKRTLQGNIGKMYHDDFDKQSGETCHKNGATQDLGYRQHNEQRLRTGWKPRRNKEKTKEMSSEDWDTEIRDISGNDCNIGISAKHLGGVSKEEIECDTPGKDRDQNEPSSNKEHKVEVTEPGEKSSELSNSARADSKDQSNSIDEENRIEDEDGTRKEHHPRKEAAVPAIEGETSTKRKVSVEKNVAKKDRPNIKVTIKKNPSTTSFDEKMSMLSPLDVPKDWADCAFDDDYLEPITF